MTPNSTPFDKDINAMIQAVSQPSACLGKLGRVLVAIALFASVAVPAWAQQKLFPTPEAAAEAFIAAVQSSDDNAYRSLFGPDFRELFPPVGAEVRTRFVNAWAASHKVIAECDQAKIAVGSDGWIFPVPLRKTAQGWRFDMKAGAEEMRIRRIGRNEIAAMQVALAYMDAQKEYASTYRDGLPQYAQMIESSPGKQDGLYWPTREGEAASPLGALMTRVKAANDEGYHGYHYKILTAQGKDAPGGARDYIVNGRMIGGFALLAWPVKYGDTGVMTFMLNQEGVIYQKDLDPETTGSPGKIELFNPGEGWIKVDSPA
jgi:hypothetical protein